MRYPSDDKVNFYARSGQRVSRKSVEKSKRNSAEARRTGHLPTKSGFFPVSVNLRLADRLDSMSLVEWANWTGAITYRPKKK